MSLEWNLHYASWIIADGQPNRSVDEEFDWFSLEFWATDKLQLGSECRKFALPVWDYKYRISAEIVFFSEKACVVDFGLKAIGYRDQLPAECEQGNYVTGEITLGLPLCTVIVPEEIQQYLSRRWHVNSSRYDALCVPPGRVSIHDPR